MGDEIQDRTEIRDKLTEHGHRPNKGLGQNFLADPNIVRKIVDVADIEGANVVEIGAGTGTLTIGLADRALRVKAYEIDERLLPVLEQTLSGRANVELIHADAASVSLSEALAGRGWTMVSNLPYNVGTGIVLDALRHTIEIERFVVMVQSEVAERFLATPGSKAYGLPSVVVGLYGQAFRVMTVPPQVFEPPPRVESTVVAIDRRPAPPGAARAIELAAAGFGQRRKMLRRSLAAVLGDPTPVLERAGVDPTARAEELEPLDYVAIARAEGSHES